MDSGIVFDIQRTSLHDGPGIRTAVFLKGCPLRCVWCHNPESIAFTPQLFCAFDKCALCGNCVGVCDRGVHKIVDGVHEIAYPRCDWCGRCVEVCNNRALKIVGRRMSVEEVMEEVLSDRPFYDSSGGGITLTGGEPLAQLAFNMALLRRCKLEHIHTCVETSGFAPMRSYAKIVSLVDIFLFDYKITDSALHKQYTGVSNARIVANLEYLSQTGIPIVLRCPIIPGVNDTEEHFKGIEAIGARFPTLRAIEIMPYHDLGNSKRESIGMPPTCSDVKSVTPQVAEGWLNNLQQKGCKLARLS